MRSRTVSLPAACWRSTREARSGCEAASRASASRRRSSSSSGSQDMGGQPDTRGARGSVRAMWRNWAGTHSCVPVAIEHPKSGREVAGAVRRAAEAGRTVRAVGAGHSFSPCVPTDGTLVRLDRLDRILDADPAGRLVKAEAGITLAALDAGLEARGLALPNLGDIDAQSLAGALATATHGTGARLPNLSAQVEGLELVDGTGERRTITADD